MCGDGWPPAAGARLLPHLRTGDGGRDFAVSFVSMMAGTLFTAEFDPLLKAG
jgi:hypothetical protein